LFDVGLIQWFQSMSRPWLDQVAVLITHLGSHYAYMVILLFIYWCVDRQVGRRLVSVVLASFWFNGMVKEYLIMPRPDPNLVRHLVTETSPGFPSGHAQGAMTMWGYLAVAFRRRWLTVLCVALILLVGVSRLYVGVHFPGDVLGGWLFGFLFVAGFEWLVRRGVGSRLSVRMKMLLLFVVPLVLLPLYQTGTAELILGFAIGFLTSDLLAGYIAPFRERVPWPQQVAKLVIGYVGFFVLLVLHMLFVPVGIPSVLGYSIMTLWITLGAPLVFRRLGLAGGEPAPKLDAVTRGYVQHYVATAAAVLALVVASTVYVHQAVPVVARPAILDSDRVLVIGHRGAAGLAPENTLPAFEAGLEHRADLLELDVRRTRDGALVLMHDETVDRTTNGRGRVADLTLDEIKALDAGYRFTADGGRTYPWRGQGVTVPTLAEVLTAFPQARFLIEVKEDTPGMAEAVLAAIDEARARDRVMVSSMHDAVVQRIRALAPDLPTGYGWNEGYRLLIFQKLGLGAFLPPVAEALQVPEWVGALRVATAGLQRVVRDKGVDLHVWTINDEEGMYRAIGLGARGIVTDYPDRLQRVLAAVEDRDLESVFY